MKNENEQKIIELQNELKVIQPEWLLLGIKLRTDERLNDPERLKTQKEWNNFGETIEVIQNKINELRTEYLVEYFDNFGYLQISIVRLNQAYDIDTKKHGWYPYLYKSEFNKLYFSIYQFLQNPEIMNIIKRPK